MRCVCREVVQHDCSGIPCCFRLSRHCAANRRTSQYTEQPADCLSSFLYKRLQDMHILINMCGTFSYRAVANNRCTEAVQT